VDDIKDVVDMLSPFYGVVYSDVVLMKVRYTFDRICLQRVHFCFAGVTMIAMIPKFKLTS
jgi:hypothetical protein